jgi:hypothetical protein
LKLNFLIPSKSVVFFCLALSNRLGSSKISGVDCLVVSRGKFDILSLGSAGVRGTSSLVLDLRATSEADKLEAIPEEAPVLHVTRDLRTATKHSMPCLLSWASERPIVDESTEPGTERAVVVSEGGMELELCLLFAGVRAGLEGSLPFGCGPVVCEVPNFEMMVMRLGGSEYRADRITKMLRTVHKYYPQPHYHSRSSDRSLPMPGGFHRGAEACS